ncbi:interleukin-17C [Dunckerocampus dactyliophorus]|uniref:interleukin-17C n=1 Tax=Dunckerocampus dactyliophorus TaxID=161453 RepID=UPI002406C597|nr:interleukin-17C [Dunckerocampus dactyliophorus]
MQIVEIVANVVIVGLLLGPVWTRNMPCYEEEELSEIAKKKLVNYPQPPEPLGEVAHDTGSSSSLDLCMKYVGQPVRNGPTNDRSLSPWRYVRKTMENHYPSSYIEAQCLCSGCIIIENGVHKLSHDYNSVPIPQSRVFLKRELCSEGHGYYLKPVSVEVVIGCTCATPRIFS